MLLLFSSFMFCFHGTIADLTFHRYHLHESLPCSHNTFYTHMWALKEGTLAQWRLTLTNEHVCIIVFIYVHNLLSIGGSTKPQCAVANYDPCQTWWKCFDVWNWWYTIHSEYLFDTVGLGCHLVHTNSWPARTAASEAVASEVRFFLSGSAGLAAAEVRARVHATLISGAYSGQLSRWNLRFVRVELLSLPASCYVLVLSVY